jgi:hypothetical protein
MAPTAAVSNGSNSQFARLTGKKTDAVPAAAAAPAAPAPVEAVAPVAEAVAAPVEVAPEVPVTTTPMAVATSDEPVKRGRGRPRKTDAQKAAEAAATPTVEPAAAVPMAEAQPAPSEPIPEPHVLMGNLTPQGLVIREESATKRRLFIDCKSDVVPSRSLEPYLESIHAAIRLELGVPDIAGHVPDSHPLAFGKWRGVLAARIRKSPPGPGDWFVYVRGDAMKEVLVSVVTTLSDTVDVIRG